MFKLCLIATLATIAVVSFATGSPVFGAVLALTAGYLVLASGKEEEERYYR